jgi:hypothetical protein
MATPEGDRPAKEAPELNRITERLRELAAELDDGPEEERAAELVREASELATEAGQEVERALRAGSQAREG